MLPFKLVYSEKYFLPIGEHIFRADKFRLIRERLLQQHAAEESDFLMPEPASESDVLLVHSPNYVNKLMEGSLTAREELPDGDSLLPASGGRFSCCTPARIDPLAAEQALQDGLCVNIGGGFHHAFPDHGEGFCMINDFAVANSRYAEARTDSPGYDPRLRRASEGMARPPSSEVQVTNPMRCLRDLLQ